MALLLLLLLLLIVNPFAPVLMAACVQLHKRDFRLRLKALSRKSYFAAIDRQEALLQAESGTWKEVRGGN